MILITVFVGVAFFVLFGVTLLPYLFFRKVSWFSSIIHSLCNCFACGVFLGTCLLSLIPHIRMQETMLKNLFYFNTSISKSDIHSYNSVLFVRILFDSNLMILIGFLFILMLGQFLPIYYYKVKNREKSNKLQFVGRSQNRNTETFLQCEKDHQSHDFRKKETGIDLKPLLNLNDLHDNESTIYSDEDVDELYSNKHNNLIIGHCNIINKNKGELQLTMLLFAMSIHSIFEGVALGAQHTFDQFFTLFISIMLHEVLCSFSFGVSMSKQNLTFKSVFLFTFLLSFSIPIGMLIMALLGSIQGFFPLIIKFLFESFSAGIFIYVACIEMIAVEFSELNKQPMMRSSCNSDVIRKWGGVFKGFAVCLGAFISFVVSILMHIMQKQ